MSYVSGNWRKVITRKHLLIAFALSSEWALAFAFARAFANSIANANHLAYPNWADFDSLSERMARLERTRVDTGMVGEPRLSSADLD